MPSYSLRILLVEDHPFQLLATQCLLRSFGFERLTPAENAEQRHASCNYKKPRFPDTLRHRKNDTPVLFLHMPQ